MSRKKKHLVWPDFPDDNVKDGRDRINDFMNQKGDFVGNYVSISKANKESKVQAEQEEQREGSSL